jgi:hypothetical protein
MINCPELQSEMNINYMSIVSMIIFFLPHLLKLSVSCEQALSDLTYVKRLDTVARSSFVHHSCYLWPIHVAGTMDRELQCIQSCTP